LRRAPAEDLSQPRALQADFRNDLGVFVADRCIVKGHIEMIMNGSRIKVPIHGRGVISDD